MPPSSITSASDSLDHTIPGAFPAADALPAASTAQSLSAAVYARRGSYTRPRRIRIKVGSWNVAGFKGTEKDLGAWFVGSKGVTEQFTGLKVTEPEEPHTAQDLPHLPEVEAGGGGGGDAAAAEKKETVEEQEARVKQEKGDTVPKGDTGNLPKEDDIGIYALGLQEIVDVNSPTEALRPYTDPTVANKYKKAMEDALPSGYKLIVEQQLIGLLLLIYAREDVAADISNVSTTSVGTGLMGYMGNKGAVLARLVLGETTRLVFVNCHLGAGADKGSVERRNWDVGQILARTRFDPIVDSSGVAQPQGEGIGQEDFCFWFGDLNYRLVDMPGDDVRRLLMLHTRNEYDIARTPGLDEDIASPTTLSTVSSSDLPSLKDQDWDMLSDATRVDRLPAEYDPASLQTTLSSLLPHDELYQQQKARKAFHDGWREGPIKFLPTYKYDVGSVGVFDSSEKRRCPSWCDRILFRTRKDKLAYEEKLREEAEARKKDEEMKARGIDHAGDEEEVLFDYNPETDAATTDDYDEYNDVEPETVITKEGYEDELALEYYVSHQRVLSSDHKPLDAIFSLKYDAVIPELKARIHQEVARELDRAENEGRPTITLIVDPAPPDDNSSTTTPDRSSKSDGVDFGAVRFCQPKRRGLTIANTGRVLATISFVDRPTSDEQASGPSPPWLRIRFDRDPDPVTGSKNSDALHPTYSLEPGDACTVTLTAHVGDDELDLVRALNAGAAGLDDILVLRVAGGRDHFLPLRGTWLPTVFGQPISTLIRIPEGGIRRYLEQQQQQQQQTSQDGGANEGNGASTGASGNSMLWSAPRELFRLTEAIEDLTERAIAEWEMTGGGNGGNGSSSGGDGSSGNVEPTTPLSPSTSSLPSSSATATDSAAIPAPVAPWDRSPGWPFTPESWTLTPGSREREALKAAVIEALDTDAPFATAFASPSPSSSSAAATTTTTATTPSPLQRLEILAETLVLFLTALPDGLVTAEVWTALADGPDGADLMQALLHKGSAAADADADFDAYAQDHTLLEDSQQQQRRADDEKEEELRLRVLERLATDPAHRSVGFVLVMSMLGRLVSAVGEAASSSSSPSSPSPSAFTTASPASPAAFTPSLPFGFTGLARAGSSKRRSIGGGMSRRRRSTALRMPSRAERRRVRRRLVERVFAEVFGPAVCRGGGEAAAERRRMAGLVAVFVRAESRWGVGGGDGGGDGAEGGGNEGAGGM